MTSATIGWISRHQLVAFFFLAYAICAVSFGALALVPSLPFGPFWAVGIFSPTIAALSVAGLTGGRPAVRAVLAGFGRWRIGWRWYLAAGALGLGALALALAWIALGNVPDGLAPNTTAGVLLGQLLFTITSGPLAEEAGWRGFALPRMQESATAP